MFNGIPINNKVYHCEVNTTADKLINIRDANINDIIPTT